MAPMVTIFFWWDDAVSFARRQASRTGVRHRVYRASHTGWTVQAQ